MSAPDPKMKCIFGAGFNTKPSHIALRCPFGAGYSVSIYVSWADVPDWWSCSCGAEHAKHPRQVSET